MGKTERAGFTSTYSNKHMARLGLAFKCFLKHEMRESVPVRMSPVQSASVRSQQGQNRDKFDGRLLPNLLFLLPFLFGLLGFAKTNTTVSLTPPLVPRDGATLRVVFFCRVSSPGEGKQDIRSLTDQEALLRQWLSAHYDGKHDVQVIAGSGSGEIRDRPEFLKLQRIVTTNAVDLILCEDVGRVLRSVQVTDFIGLCIDHQTRLISINDSIDTAERSWFSHAIMASFHHEISNRDTSDRIKRSHRARFQNGGCVGTLPYGYIKKPGAKTDADVERDPAARSVLKHWFEMLEEGASFGEVADYLNQKKVPLPKYCRSNRWTGTMVGRITRNPIYKGLRERNRKKSVRHNQSGKYRCVKADPSELLTREVPHLAFFDAEYFDRVVAMVNRRNACYARPKVNGHDPLLHRPKKQTRWPGQHLRCGVCGRMFLFSGFSDKDMMKCKGVTEHKCWNAAGIHAERSAQKILHAILDHLERMPEFDQVLRSQVEDEYRKLVADRTSQLDRLKDEDKKIRQKIDRLTEAIENGQAAGALVEALQNREMELADITAQIAKLTTQAPPSIALPSMNEIRKIARERLGEIDVSAPDLHRALHELIPDLRVFPYRLLDGTTMVQRASVKVSLLPLVESSNLRREVIDALTFELEVPLYDVPEWVAKMPDIMAYREASRHRKHNSRKQAAKKFGFSELTIKQAEDLWAKMKARCTNDPYERVNAPLNNLRNYFVHKHPRYRFEPLEE